jgi:hypothetical protein
MPYQDFVALDSSRAKALVRGAATRAPNKSPAREKDVILTWATSFIGSPESDCGAFDEV